MPDYTQELTRAREAAVHAGVAILKYYGAANLKVTHKSAEQPLTLADIEANQAIKNVLGAAFPDDGWMSEEDPDGTARLSKRRVWVVDPLDGTRDFIENNPEFAVSIALVEDFEPVVGVILNPAKRETFWSARGAGAFADGKKIRVSNNADLKQIHVIASRSENRRGEWEEFKKIFKVTPVGGSAYKMGVVARGDADGAFTRKPKNEWDIAAGHAIITEAGGTVTRLDGSPMLYNRENPRIDGLVYSNGLVHGFLLKSIGG